MIGELGVSDRGLAEQVPRARILGRRGAGDDPVVQQFVDEHSLRYPIMLVSLADFKRAGRDYGFDGIPTLVLIDRKGRLRNSWSGLRPGLTNEVHEEIQKLVAER